MSKRDHGLLNAAGISVAQVAVLSGRSRPAIYTGLASARPYFSAKDAMAILHDAKRRDSDQINQLVEFISNSYPESQSELILLDRVGYELMARVVRDADKVMIAFNGNVDNLTPTATFASVLRDVTAAGNLTLFMVPGDWAIGYIDQNLKVKVYSYVTTEEVTYLPSFIVAEKRGRHRAFFFMRLAAEEMHPTEAARLWTHFESMYSENVPNRRLEAG